MNGNSWLLDLEKIEAYHWRKALRHREHGENVLAQIQQSMAETVRVCIVTVQAAENKDRKNAEKQTRTNQT